MFFRMEAVVQSTGTRDKRELQVQQPEGKKKETRNKSNQIDNLDVPQHAHPYYVHTRRTMSQQ
jgi:hypothetical protein